MTAQDKEPKPPPLTGAHIAPKPHGAGCACCLPEEGEEDEESLLMEKPLKR